MKGCSPFVPAQCATPFPSSWFEERDPATATGLSVMFPDGTLPVNNERVVVRQSSFGALDGFSPATPILVYFKAGVGSAQLAALNGASSIYPASPIVLCEAKSLRRIPFFAELDANAKAGDRQALIIRPLARLQPASRYIVAIRTALKDASGAPLRPEGQFAKWVDGSLGPSDPLWEIGDRLDSALDSLALDGISRGDLALMFDFDTASEAALTGRLVKMRDAAIAAAPAGLGYRLSSVMEPAPADDPHAFRTIEGTFDAPSFEMGADPALLNLDAKGDPIIGAPAPWPLFAVIPRCALDAPGPVPLLIIGHGLFDTAKSELLDDRELLDRLCMVGIGTDWLGVREQDFAVIGATILPDANRFGLITDRLQQAHANFQVLVRLAQNALARDPAFSVNGHPAYDPASAKYWGASNGGIQGATFLALSLDIHRGVLNVPGAAWSAMIWRSSHFSAAVTLLTEAYRDRLDQQVLIALSQSLFDRTDPIEFAPHLVDPLPGVGRPKQALFQESIGDAQVPNLATRLLMRSIRAKGLAPLVEPVFEIDEAEGPLEGIVYTQWNVMPSPLPPPTNTPAEDNAAHDAVRRLAPAIEQTRRFLSDGQVINTCNGPCVFPPGT